MDRRRPLGLVDGLLVIGLAMSVIDLVVVTAPLTDFAAIGGSFRSGRIASPLASASAMIPPVRLRAHAAPVTVSQDPALAFPTAASRKRRAQDDRGRQGDDRLYLHEAAAVARQYLWARPWDGEIRTQQWIISPGSIGSTSRP